MNKFYFAGVETNSAIRIRAFGSVFEIPFNGASDSGELAPDLMMPPGLKVNLKECVVLATHERLIGQYRLFGFFGAGLGNKRFIELLIARKVVLQPCFGNFRSALNYCPIRFTDLLVGFEHLIEAREGFGSTGKEHHPTRRTIEPMRDTEEDFTGFVVLGLDVLLHRFAQRRIPRLVSLHDLVAGLIDSDNMVVFV